MKIKRGFLFYFRNSLFLLFIAISPVCGQSPRLDSLLNVVATMPDDTNKVNTLYQIGRIYLKDFNDRNKVGEYGHKELQLARKLNYKKGIAQAMIHIAIMYRSTAINYNLSLYYDRTALKIMEELGDKKGESNALGNIGLTFSKKGDYKQALEYMKKGLEIKRALGDKRGLSIGYNNMANIYHTQGNYTEAMAAHLTSLRINEELKDSNAIAFSYLNIAALLNSQEKLDESLVYCQKSAQVFETIRNFQDLGKVYGNMGDIYRKKKQLKKALLFMLKEAKINEQMDDKLETAISYNNIASVYVDDNKPEIALVYQRKAYELSKQRGDKKILIDACASIARSYESKKDFTDAIRYNLEALTLCRETNYKEAAARTYSNLASIYRKQKQYEKALEYTVLYNAMKDSLLNTENFKQITELNTRYETEKKEKEILLLTKDQQLNSKIIRQQQLVRWSLIAGLGLLSISIFSIYRRYRFKQKANIILEKQKKEIQEKNTLITDSIDYAKTIQEAVLPTEQEIKNLFPESFVLYKPKDIVSGDFYWLSHTGNRLTCAVADCTGHGVPGAFMSMLGYNMLEDVAQSTAIKTPGLMLDALNEQVIRRLSGNDQNETGKHGMDISLISIDKTTNRLEYAGAHNSLYIIRGDKLIELKADKISIGSRKAAGNFFSNQAVDLQKGDMIYLFTDGFPDQLGGPKRKKFFYPPFKTLFKTISNLEPESQLVKLNEAHLEWKGQDMDQTDDILIIGIRY